MTSVPENSYTYVLFDFLSQQLILKSSFILYVVYHILFGHIHSTK